MLWETVTKTVLAFFPKRSGEHEQDGEEFETAYKHKERTEPFGSSRHRAP